MTYIRFLTTILILVLASAALAETELYESWFVADILANDLDAVSVDCEEYSAGESDLRTTAPPGCFVHDAGLDITRQFMDLTLGHFSDIEPAISWQSQSGFQGVSRVLILTATGQEAVLTLFPIEEFRTLGVLIVEPEVGAGFYLE